MSFKMSLVINNVINDHMNRYIIMSCKISRILMRLCVIMLLMSFKISLNCTEMACINDIIKNIDDKISFQGSFAIKREKLTD